MHPFVNAKQIFIKNKRENVNFQAGFKCVFNADEGNNHVSAFILLFQLPRGFLYTKMNSTYIHRCRAASNIRAATNPSAF